MEQIWNEHMRDGLRSGLLYGIGLLAATAVTALLYRLIDLWIRTNEAGSLGLLAGVLLAFTAAAVGAFVAGFIGGRSLKTLSKSHGRFGYAWRSAFTMAPIYGFLLYPLVFIVSLLSLYTEIQAAGLQYGLLLAILGLVFGTLYSLLLAVTTAGSGYIGRVTWAGAIGFMFGGFLFGYMIWLAIRNASLGEFRSVSTGWFLTGTFVFGLLGGGSLGREYSILSAREGKEHFVRKRWLTWRKGIVLGILLVLLIWVIRPAVQTVAQMLQPVDANLATRLGNDATTTHWSDAFAVNGSTGNGTTTAADVAVNAAGQVAAAWQTADGIYVAAGLWGPDGGTTWAEPLQIAPAGNDPQVAVDDRGALHLVWEQDGLIQYARCEGRVCAESRSLSNASGLACDGTAGKPVLFAGAQGTQFVAWETPAGAPYAIWSSGGTPPGIPVACLPLDAPADLAVGGGNGRVQVAASSGAQIVVIELDGSGEWSEPAVLGDGRLPALWTDGTETAVVWCSPDAQPLPTLWQRGAVETVSERPCRARPQVARDDAGNLHVLWASDEVVNQFGVVNPATVLYETIQEGNAWSAETIVARTAALPDPAVASSSASVLFMSWPDAGSAQVASQTPYVCDELPASPVMQNMLALAQSPVFRPEGDPVPYCGNRYDGLTIMPGPLPAFSDQPPTLNGAFDLMADLVSEAQYEAVYSTMWYDADVNNDSPGAVVMAGVAELYEKVKANPENYPRGMTVRILLGNPPEFARGEFAGQLWHVLDDLRDAGVDKMIDREIGWSVEVADYEGALPHSHAKTLVVDGKTAVAAGYNMSYAHFWEDHPSGLGESRLDLGVHLTGPVAQDALRAFDDLWDGASRRHCTSLYPLIAEAWQVTCGDFPARVTHVPEVLRYYLPGATSNAFSMYRSHAYDLADEQVATALASAQESIDLIHVNFTMEMICDLNLFFDVCGFDEVLPFTRAIVDAAEQNGARVRILVKPFPVDGIESTFNVQVLGQEIQERGLQDQIEVRLLDGAMHAKTALIDDAVLIIGSQNFHYSAFGDGSGLNEYSLSTDDPQAAADYKRLFEYYWERALPTEIDGE